MHLFIANQYMQVKMYHVQCTLNVAIIYKSVFVTQILLYVCEMEEEEEEKNNLIYPLLRLYISRFIYLCICMLLFFSFSRSFILTEEKAHTTTLWAAVWFV